jgi:hypothetical protein
MFVSVSEFICVGLHIRFDEHDSYNSAQTLPEDKQDLEEELARLHVQLAAAHAHNAELQARLATVTQQSISANLYGCDSPASPVVGFADGVRAVSSTRRVVLLDELPRKRGFLPVRQHVDEEVTSASVLLAPPQADGEPVLPSTAARDQVEPIGEDSGMIIEFDEWGVALSPPATTHEIADSEAAHMHRLQPENKTTRSSPAAINQLSAFVPSGVARAAVADPTTSPAHSSKSATLSGAQGMCTPTATSPASASLPGTPAEPHIVSRDSLSETNGAPVLYCALDRLGDCEEESCSGDSVFLDLTHEEPLLTSEAAAAVCATLVKQRAAHCVESAPLIGEGETGLICV